MSKKSTSLRNSNVSKNEARQKLNEFYQVAKENLLKMKQELDNAKENYDAQLARFQELSLKYHDILIIKEKKDIELKGREERKLVLEKQKSNMVKQIKDIENESAFSTKEIDRLETSTFEKVSKNKSSEDHIKNLKENQVEGFNERIKKEKEKNNHLREKIREVENKISEYKTSLNDMQMIDGKKGDLLLKDTAEMTKFLADL